MVERFYQVPDSMQPSEIFQWYEVRLPGLGWNRNLEPETDGGLITPAQFYRKKIEDWCASLNFGPDARAERQFVITLSAATSYEKDSPEVC